MIFSLYALPSITSAVIIFSLFIYIFIFRRHRSGAWQAILLMLGFFIWSFGYAMTLLHTEFSHKLFWLNLSQIGPDFTPILWLFLILEHTGHKKVLSNKWLYTVFIFPLITTLLMWTDWKHLLRTKVFLSNIASNISYIKMEHGPWFYWESFYGYIFIVLSFVLLFRFLDVSSSKKQTLTIICSMFIPVLSNLLDIFQINPLKPFGPTSIAFSITGIILAWGLFREHFLDIAPIARNIVLEKIGDGVVVLDNHYRIVDLNPAAYPLFVDGDGSSSHLIGKKFFESLSIWPESNEPLIFSDDARTEKTLKVNNGQRCYTVTSTSISTRQHEPVGWVVIFNDVTEIKQANVNLQNQLDEINKLHDQLREQAIRDSLTGCYNRHYLNEILVREFSRANREKSTIGLMMLDIDHFKQINDDYGHIDGDKILRTLGEALRKWVRAEDMVFRYGGEEFLVVFPGIQLPAFRERAKILCERIATLNIPLSSGHSTSMTVSVGISLLPTHHDDIFKVLEYADQALYKSKNSGRNTVSVWEPVIDNSL